MKYIRKILGAIIIALDAITRPRPMKRSDDDQKQVNAQASNLSLYQFHSCPFCVKVRRTLHKLNVKVKLNDAMNDDIGKELLEGGGRRKVPCLRINDGEKVQWMYESKVIIEHLVKSFG